MNGKLRIVVLFSGGIDSTVVLWKLRSAGHECIALGINYGQRHSVELHHASKIAGSVGVEFSVATASVPWSDSALTGMKELPIGVSGSHPSQSATVVPGRNLMFLSMALAKAIAVDADGIAIGCHQGDAAIYADCRGPFLTAFEHLTRLAVGRLVGIYRPLLSLTKTEVVAEGRRLGVPMDMTYSCYAGGNHPCGLCGACVERNLAMKETQ